jgi:hypothetical protein
MKLVWAPAVLLAAGLLFASPGMAQTSNTAQPDARKQHTEGYLGNDYSTGGPGATKQRTEGQNDGGDLNIGPGSKAKPQ